MPWKKMFIAALAIAPAFAIAAEVTPPAVPTNLTVPEGNEPFAVGHAVGTQNYVCLPSDKRVKWVQYSPQATLFNDDGQQTMTHFLSPNPAESDAPRATWQDSRDTSAAWATVQEESNDSQFVAPGAIKWLLLRVVGSQSGPDSGDRLSKTTFIQRVNTSGGVAPATGCTSSTDVGKKVLVPYMADYFFYR